MKKDEFLRIFNNAMEIRGIKYIAVKVNQPQGGFELIVFGKDLFESKFEYYNKAYDDDMKLKTFDKIYISDIDFCNVVGVLTEDMFE